MSDITLTPAPSGPVLHAPGPNESYLAPDLWQWHDAASAAALPADVAAVVPVSAWLEHGQAWRDAGARRGVWLAGDDDPAQLADQLDGLTLVAVVFPAFSDGRGFSAARHLRRYGWQGELRAVGDVLIDTVNYLARCGFDSFQLKLGHDPELARQQLRWFPQPYQRGYRPLAGVAA